MQALSPGSQQPATHTHERESSLQGWNPIDELDIANLTYLSIQWKDLDLARLQDCNLADELDVVNLIFIKLEGGLQNCDLIDELDDVNFKPRVSLS